MGLYDYAPMGPLAVPQQQLPAPPSLNPSFLGALSNGQFWKDIASGLAAHLGSPLPTMQELNAAIPSGPYSVMDEPLKQAAIHKMIGLGALIGPITYHGSPHTFDNFNAEKIGTGEGAQAYGYGHYLAENPRVAQQYATDIHARNVGRSPISWTHESPGPQLYTVNLPDQAAEKMLDLDKLLSQQPEVLAAAKRAGYSTYLNKIGNERPIDEMMGKEFVDKFSSLYPRRMAEDLSAQGIPGIKYLDQGSRTAGAGTHNYVVFPGNEDLMKIIGRK